MACLKVLGIANSPDAATLVELQRRPAHAQHQSPSPHTPYICPLLPGLNPIPGALSQLLAHPLTLPGKALGLGVQVQVRERVLVAVAHLEGLG